MANHKSTRYIYTGELARPLRPGQLPEDKLPLLYANLGVSTDADAIIALVVRHISGFQRVGPKTRAYPSGPLRWHLKVNQNPEDKLALLHAYLNVTTAEEALLALAVLHVPGFRNASPLRNGGRKLLRMKSRSQTCAAADVDDAWMCEIIDMIKQNEPHKKLFAIAYDLSRDKPPVGCENPAYGLNPEWIVQRYTNRKRYDKSADKRLGRLLRRLKALL